MISLMIGEMKNKTGNQTSVWRWDATRSRDPVFPTNHERTEEYKRYNLK
jgi:hypothetical protein